VIGLGTEKDSDAAVLKDIARLGKGRIFFTEDATTVPNIFAQETVAVARSMFIKDPVGLAATGRWLEISRDSLEWLPQVDGYNLSYARPQSSVASVTTDDYKAPLVAYVQRGLGRTAAVSFPLGGENSGATRAWPAMPDFIQTLTRWLMGETLPPGLGLRTELNGTELTVDLLHDDTWFQRLAVPPKVFLADGTKAGDDAIREVTWERIEPGHFRATTQLDYGRLTRGAIQVGDSAIAFGPVIVGGSPEWSFDRTRIEELREVSARSGGEERINLAEVWKQPSRKEFATIQPWLLVAVLLLVLAEALFTRLGWTWAWTWQSLVSRFRPRAAARAGAGASGGQAAYRATDQPGASGVPSADPLAGGRPGVPAAAEPPSEPDDASEKRRSRFDRAKRRR
jgi:hypothetical protein